MNPKYNLTIIVLASLITISCGSKKASVSNESDYSSQLPYSQGTITYCNQVQADFFKANIMLFENNGQYTDNAIRMKVLAANYLLNSNQYYLQFFKWKANSSGATYLDPTPLEFRLELRNNGPISVSTYYDELDIDLLEEIRDARNLSGASFYDLAKQMNIVFTDLSLDYDAIKVVLYKGSTAEDSADFLIPAFHANPKNYSYDSDRKERSEILKNLHPFINELNQGWSEQHFETEFKNFCFQSYDVCS